MKKMIYICMVLCLMACSKESDVTINPNIRSERLAYFWQNALYQKVSTMLSNTTIESQTTHWTFPSKGQNGEDLVVEVNMKDTTYADRKYAMLYISGSGNWMLDDNVRCEFTLQETAAVQLSEQTHYSSVKNLSDLYSVSMKQQNLYRNLTATFVNEQTGELLTYPAGGSR